LSAFESIFNDIWRSVDVVLGWYQICMRWNV
jgi:hypothetical protein